MLKDPSTKYPKAAGVELEDRRWPSKSIEKPPIWCSVDLRDGNQALVEPMDLARKGRLFDLIVELGFKEVEIGFPSASRADFDFCRKLVDEDRIPSDVTIQVLVQAREHLVKRTFEALDGVNGAIIHVYNSTSTLQRRVVFGRDRNGIKEMAVDGARLVQECAARHPNSHWTFEYSPESFTGTEPEYAAEVCDAVIGVWKPTAEHKAIVNLPATVEMTTPNVYADQIEWMGRQFADRERLVLSIHPHNDRGTAVAAAELALMAGAERVEGTLFGNGERTGNVDVVTLALNMYSQGLDPGLNFSDVEKVIECVEFCNRLPVHPRHPYAGELVFTAFSGSHQDAIRKGMAQRSPDVWEVPYLPVDPKDLGRSYTPIVRVNSQSGKGGVAYLLERDFGVRLPRRLQMEFAGIVQRATDSDGGELTPEQLWFLFQSEYVNQSQPIQEYSYENVTDDTPRILTTTLNLFDVEYTVSGVDDDPVDAFINALSAQFGLPLTLLNRDEYSIYALTTRGQAICIVEIETATVSTFGVGIDDDKVLAALNSIVNALRRAVERGAKWITEGQAVPLRSLSFPNSH